LYEQANAPRDKAAGNHYEWPQQGVEEIMVANIQVLRFAAAFLVCVLHVGLFNGDMPGFLMGGSGVDLFFVISGFIMVVSSDKLFGTSGASWEFLRRRIVRIVPMYWLATLTYLGLQLYFGGISLNPRTPDVFDRAVAGLFFFPLPNLPTNPFLPTGWTLNHEAYFYALFTIAVYFRRNIAVALTIVAIFASVVLGQLSIVPNMGMQKYWFSGVNLEFVWGIVAGYLYCKNWRPTPKVSGIIVLLGVSGLLVPYSWTAIAREIYLGLPAALIVFGAACLPQISTKNLFGRTLILLGDSSYALYLLHWIFFWYVHQFSQPVLLMMAVSLSVAIRLLIEKPILRLLNRRSDVNRGSPEVSPLGPGESKASTAAIASS